jgi:hypothetical protein
MYHITVHAKNGKCMRRDAKLTFLGALQVMSQYCDCHVKIWDDKSDTPIIPIFEHKQLTNTKEY